MLQEVIDRLKDRVGSLRLVEGAAEFATANETGAPQSPAAVAARGDQAEPGILLGSVALTPDAAEVLAAVLDPTIDIVQFVAALILREIALAPAVSAQPTLGPATQISHAALEAALGSADGLVLDAAVTLHDIPLVPAVAGKPKLN